MYRADTGEPITDFTFTSTTSDGTGRLQRICKAKDGAFSFAHTGAADTTIEISAPGLGSTSQNVTIAKGSNDFVFRIAPERAIHGHVLDSNGQPVESAYLVKRFTSFSESPLLEQEALAKTDPEGAFAVVGLPQTTKSIFVVSRDFAPLEVPVVRQGEWSIILPEGSTVEGTVSVAGEPQPDQRVGVHLRPKDSPEGSGYSLESRTDSEGYYRISGLSAGEADVGVDILLGSESNRVWKSVQKTASVGNRGTTVLDFDVRPPDATVSGHVYEGTKPARAQVSVAVPTDAGPWSGHGGISDPSGAYQVSGLWSGPARIIATLSDPLPRTIREEFALTPGDMKNRDVRFSEGCAIIEGRIILLEGLKFRISLGIEIVTANGTETIDLQELPIKDDSYHLDNLPAGTTTMKATLRTENGTEVKRVYDLTLKPNAVARQDIDFGNCSIYVEVSGQAPGELAWLSVYPGRPALPDFHSITASERERFNQINPPVVQKPFSENTLAPVQPGVYTVVVTASSSKVDGGGEPVPNQQRTAIETVSVPEDTEATVTLSLE